MPTIPSITFLIGGKFSEPATRAPPELRRDRSGVSPVDESSNRHGRPALKQWYRPCEPQIYNFYRFASEQWGDVYGVNSFGVFGLEGESFFGWRGADDPTYDVVRRAADALLARCRRLRDEYGTKQFRFVGHSAGCWVANIATHYADFDVHELILCSPSVPRPWNIPDGWSRDKLAEAYPNVKRLAAGKFYYFFVKPDTVLAFLGRHTRYHAPFLDQEFPEVVAAARTPGKIWTIDLFRGHWRTVDHRVWKSPPHLDGETYLEWIARQ